MVVPLLFLIIGQKPPATLQIDLSGSASTETLRYAYGDYATLAHSTL